MGDTDADGSADGASRNNRVGLQLFLPLDQSHVRGGAMQKFYGLSFVFISKGISHERQHPFVIRSSFEKWALRNFGDLCPALPHPAPPCKPPPVTRRYHHHHHHHYHQQQQQQHHHSAKAEWCDRWCLSVSRSFVLSVCEQDYCKSNQPICLKLDVVIGPTNRKNWLAVDGDPVRDTDSWLLFHFGHHWRIGDLTHGTVTSTTVTRHVGERL